VTTGAGKAGKSAIILNGAGKAVLFLDREAGKAGISTFEMLNIEICFPRL